MLVSSFHLEECNSALEHTVAGTAWRQMHSQEEILLCPWGRQIHRGSQSLTQGHQISPGE
ncbi:hypothetical protein Nmel_005755 [Mimus melanotis]